MKATRSMTSNRWPYLFITPYFLFYAVFGAFPILFTLYMSMTNWDLFGNRDFVGLLNFKRLFLDDAYFMKSIGNALLFMACSLPILIIGGMLLASVIESKWLRGKAFFRLSLFSPFLTTPIAIGIIFSLMFDWQGGILNNVLVHLHLTKENVDWMGQPGTARLIIVGMIVWKNLGYFVMFYTAGIISIDSSIYEAAMMDGAKSRQVFYHITFPLLKPMTLFLLITSIIDGMQLVEEPMLLYSGWASGSQMVGGPDGSVFTPIWYMMDASFRGSSFQYGKGAAIAYSTFLFIIAFSFIGSRWMNRREQTE